MRILCWTPFFLPDTGGIETLLAKLLPQMQENGHEFTVVSSFGRYETAALTSFKGIPIYRFRTREAIQGQNLRELMHIRREVRALKERFQPDLVHVHFADPSSFFHLETADVCPAPTLVTMHGNLAHYGMTGGIKSILERLLTMSKWITAVSQDTLESDVLAYLPEVVSKSSVVYNGVETPELQPSPLPFSPPRLLCLGRLVEQKGFDLAIAAFARLRRRFPELHLTIAGIGPLEAALKAQAERLGVLSAINFCGYVEPPDIPALVNEATVVLMPSRSEGFPMVALEVGIMGRPIVAADAGGIRELVSDGETGFLVAPEDVTAIEIALCTLLESPATCAQIGAQARNRIASSFSLAQTTAEYDQLYRQLSPLSVIVDG